MKKDLDEKLTREFPLLYSDRHESMMITCMCWGFSCDDGWFDIIYKLSSKLEPLIIKYIKDNEGSDEYKDRSYPKAAQIKEKYGELRFYMTHTTDEMNGLIKEAEKKSGVTCEHCGEAGEKRNIRWIKTLC